MRASGFGLMTWLLALIACALPASAATHITPTLVAESAAPAAGQVTTLALAMKPDKGWHGYWKNPGDSGVETSIAWDLPKGVSIGPLAYPVPHRLLIAGLMNYVYEADYAHLMELRLDPGSAAGTRLPIRGRANWLACTDEICVPEQADLAIDLVAGDGRIEPAGRARFDAWRAALPRPLGGEARFAISGGKFRLGVPLPAAHAIGEAYFYPLTDGVIDYAAPQAASRNGDMLVIETKAREGAEGRVEGVLAIGDGQGLSLVATPGEVAAAGVPLQGASEAVGGARAILLALAGALIGGLLLNVMPCVFPILSLKALSLARAGESQADARAEALAYAAGAILICMMLGGVLLGLRAGGSAVGWAFQLQDPRVILLLLLLVVAIALNLAGVFDLTAISGGGNLTAQGGLAGAFWTGALAAFVATPCTGPFMGAALGAALVLPAAAAMAVFAGLGLGLALPFLLIGFVPAARRALPRPGAWMDRLRRILAIPMFATALGLAWILGRQAGVDGMTMGLGAALLLGLGLWWVGRRQAIGRPRAWWPVIPAAAAALALLALTPREAAIAAAKPESLLGAEPFSEARLAALRNAGRPVFLYFTADWCLTCKVNERAAIERAEVAQAFRDKKIAVMVGDWTRGDPVIGRFLAAHGRSGVPLYLFYPKGGGPQLLPQILTPGRLTALAG
jgi:thiol:disulfide interchange protein